MSADALATCRWREPGGVGAALTIARFLEGIGIETRVGALPDGILMPNMDVAAGVIVVDPQRPGWPGDLLHEAGHLAVNEESERQSDELVSDPGREMAAIAWSVAAARACGVPLATLFHPEGYKGGSDSLIVAFDEGRGFGVPLLAWYGMTTEASFPAMSRWLR